MAFRDEAGYRSSRPRVTTQRQPSPITYRSRATPTRAQSAASQRYQAQARAYAQRAQNTYAGRYQVQQQQYLAAQRAAREKAAAEQAAHISQQRRMHEQTIQEQRQNAYLRRAFPNLTRPLYDTGLNRANQAYAQRLQASAFSPQNFRWPGQIQLNPYVNQRANHYRYQWVSGYDPIRAQAADAKRLSDQGGDYWSKDIPTMEAPPTDPGLGAGAGSGDGGWGDWGDWGGYGGGGGGGGSDYLREYYNQMINWAINRPNRGG